MFRKPLIKLLTSLVKHHNKALASLTLKHKASLSKRIKKINESIVSSHRKEQELRMRIHQDFKHQQIMLEERHLKERKELRAISDKLSQEKEQTSLEHLKSVITGQ